MSYINQVIILRCGPICFIITPFQKRSFFPLQFGQERIYLETQLKGQFTDLF